MTEQGWKRPLDTQKRMIERREREGEREKGRNRDIESLRSCIKSSGNLPSGEIKRKERLITKIMTCNYEGKLWVEIITGNYQWKLSASILCRGKMWEL